MRTIQGRHRKALSGMTNLLPLLLMSLFALSLSALASAASAPVILNSETHQFSLGSAMQAFRDTNGKLTPFDALTQETGWQDIRSSGINFGIDSDDWWFRADIINQAASPEDYLLEIAYPSLDHVAIYIFESGNLIEQHLLGDHRPFAERPINHHFLVVPTVWPENSPRTLLIHVRTTGALQLPITLWQKSAFASHDQTRQLLSGLYFGAMLVMLIYNLFMYFGIGDRSYLYYVGFVLSVPLFVSSLTGYSFQYFWPDSVIWNGQSIGFFLSTMVVFGILFTRDFLQLGRKSLPIFIKAGMQALTLIALLMLASVFLTSYNTMLITVICGAVIACIGALLVGAYGLLNDERPALFYVLAWSALLIGGIVLAASKLSIIPQNMFTDNAVQVGSMMLVLLLSFAMAERINEERRRRYRAQMQSLQNERRARQAQEQALNAEREANLQLEAKVAERTEALAKANAVLQDLSDTDSLTGLRNRRFLDEQLQREFIRCYRYQHPLSVILIDIDHFKVFNDTYGHQVGDECLRLVANQIAHCVARDSDTAARYGGEEFCLVLPETDTEGARAVAERIRRKISESPFMVSGNGVPITASFGVACIHPSTPEGYDSLIREADAALYQAKDEGRNRVVVAFTAASS
ncbi:MAG: diguanylate cyclase [Gammaproteobacteria bacterium HGW-Gammaproteobacteria-14]|nr:MAG: diguanylate cyclase [Gammaproteobacteria bacterium HGW-Gammaproteobacteria-14]